MTPRLRVFRLRLLALSNKWRTLRGRPEKPELLTFERNLRGVFWQDEADFVSRAVRLFVLYEDLRIEYLGAMIPIPIEAIEDIGKNYRRNYFIRRSLVSLIEFSGALNRLNAIKEWRQHIEQENDDIAKRWKAAIAYFNDNHKRWETLRGDIGGHFPESTAMFALKNLSEHATGELHLRQFHRRKQGGILFPFADEFVAVGMRKTMKVEEGKEPTEEELRKFFAELFEAITDGWEHAVGAVNIVAKQYLEPRFITEEHRTRLGLS
jgi:hypothetical protein